MLLTIIIVVLVLMLFGSLPVWPHASNWGGGYYAPGFFGIVLILIVLWIVLGGGREHLHF